MNMPAFTAETSLYRVKTNWCARGSHGSFGSGAVTPQLPPAGCGECTPLRWPDGRPTGICARQCCDVLRVCRDETCPCPGRALIGGGFGGIFAV
jgi:hypothetical protein